MPLLSSNQAILSFVPLPLRRNQVYDHLRAATEKSHGSESFKCKAGSLQRAGLSNRTVSKEAKVRAEANLQLQRPLSTPCYIQAPSTQLVGASTELPQSLTYHFKQPRCRLLDHSSLTYPHSHACSGRVHTRCSSVSNIIFRTSCACLPRPAAPRWYFTMAQLYDR